MLDIEDLKKALVRFNLSLEIAKADLRKSYNRTVIGPFWETISLGLLLSIMSIVWSQIIKSDDVSYVPYLVIGMVVWRFISQVLNSSSWLFIERDDIIKYFNIPLSSLAITKVIYAIFIFFHHLPLIFIFCFYYKINLIHLNLFYLLYGIVVFIITSYSISLLIGILTLRFRDMISLINTITSVMIFFTPILWSPDKLSGKTKFYVIDFNIIYHYIELIRQPFLGNAPSNLNISVTLVSTLFLLTFALFILNKFKSKIRYWI